MTDPTRHDEFVRSLLALDDGVSEQRYADYRRRLDRRLDEEARRRARAERPAFRQRLRACLAAAALLTVLGGTAALLPVAPVEAPTPGISEVVLLAAPDARGRDASAPFEHATLAGFVAVARSGEPVRRPGGAVVPLHIERVLKDETGQQTPTFCRPADGDAPRGQQFVLFLDHSRKAGWQVRDVEPVDEHYEKSVLPGVIRCVDLVNAARCEDPSAHYERLLSPQAGGLDGPASCVFSCRPDPRSADVLLARLLACREQLEAGEDVGAQFVRLAEALAPLHEARAVAPVVETAPRLPPESRGALYRVLPALCSSATPEVRTRVEGFLRSEIESPAPGGRPADIGSARRALYEMSRSIR